MRGIQLPGECGGKLLSLDEAATTAPFKLLVPDHELASVANLQSTEWCAASELVVMTFSSGIRVEQSSNQIPDPAADFAQQADPAEGVTVGTIRNQPALFVSPGAKDDAAIEPAPGGIEFVEDQVLVDIVGDGSIPLDQLKSVTETLAQFVDTSLT